MMLLSVALNAQETTIQFSVPGGFYDSVFSVALSYGEEGIVIRYTTNGNTPTETSSVYTNPLTLGEDLYSHSDIYTIQNCSDSLWFAPESVKKCIVIRAAAFDAQGNRISEVTTNSYFIRSLGCDTHGLSVVSICADSVDLFDYERGIMVPGVCYDSSNWGWSGNYYQHGREWERKCNVEFYELDNKGINQQAGLRMHGNCSRGGRQKGMALYARKEYGKCRFQHPFFDGTQLSSFKHLVLKPFAHRQVSNALPDAVCMSMAKSLNVETLAFRFVVLFINGEYWGMYNLREKPDEHFVADHYGFDPDEINMMESWKGDASCGDNSNFNEMMQWLSKADLSSPENYRKACAMIDIDNLVDYYCLELYIGNIDWPHNNMRCWQSGNGSWRWVFYDGDDCLDDFDYVIHRVLVSEKKVTESTLLFVRLMSNEAFRDCFYARFGGLMTHQFDYQTTSKYLEESVAVVNAEVENQIARFGIPMDRVELDKQIWQIDFFLKCRTLHMSYALYHLYSYKGWQFNLSKSKRQRQFRLESNVYNPKLLLWMARQFKDWRYVQIYFQYKWIHFKATSRLWRWLMR